MESKEFSFNEWIQRLNNTLRKLSPPPIIRKAECAPSPSTSGATSAPPPSSLFYVACGIGGAVCCGTTHLAVVPLDVIKCRMQVDASNKQSMIQVLQQTAKREGMKTLTKGWAPTTIGYALQGFSKFGLYEVFKPLYASFLSEEAATKYRMLVYLAASSSAEAVGDVLLAPMEAVKVRMQTDPKAPNSMRACLPLMYKGEGLAGLFKGLPPLWMRQIPYTASKFVCFETVSNILYSKVGGKESCTEMQRYGVTTTSALIAGVVCAICSHPPDVIVSVMYNNSDMGFMQACKQLGWKGVWRGVHARMLMIASIATAQLILVDKIKMIVDKSR